MDVKNYGTDLSKEIIDKSYSKKKIAEHLKVSINTLEARLEDGNFTINQLNTLREKRYLPNE